MSKTDKTDPYWIQVQRPPKGVVIVEHHRCGNGRKCDLGIYLPCTRRPGGRRVLMPHCNLWPKRYRCDKIFGRHPRREVRKALGFEGKIRGELVKLRRQWRHEDREGIDSSWGAPRRRCQVRDPWHWD